ncbi:MAG TPA: NADPH-dependent 2,4-dienoyl-CoA reductase, partial [Brachybacterium massiliense]|nr:NADPH-dependent 2,4-dienoyl-CoA reductase [Brachybacterium massiliense]
KQHWGVVDADEEHRGGVITRPSAPARREVHLLQRKESRIGATLGRTTGWVHRAELRHAGVIQHRGVTYRHVDEQGLHILEGEEAAVLDVDTVVICAGQESVNELAGELTAARRGRSPRVHVIGGADVAAELDAERAIRQAVEVVAAL